MLDTTSLTLEPLKLNTLSRLALFPVQAYTQAWSEVELRITLAEVSSHLPTIRSKYSGVLIRLPFIALKSFFILIIAS